jgi:hypothetical protein
MIKNLKQLIFILLIFFSITVFSAEAVLIDGIWQDEAQENAYYSISQDGNTVVIIDLKRLEAGKSTLAATYVGSLSDLLLTPLAKSPKFPFDQTPIRVFFTSNTEGTMTFEDNCDLCSLISVTITKIFN